MATISVAPVTLGVGDTVLGPYAIPAGWTQIEVGLDLLALVSPVWVAVEISPDGVTWQANPITKLDYTGPVTTALVYRTYPPAPGATPKLRLRVMSGAILVSTGGTITVN